MTGFFKGSMRKNLKTKGVEEERLSEAQIIAFPERIETVVEGGILMAININSKKFTIFDPKMKSRLLKKQEELKSQGNRMTLIERRDEYLDWLEDLYEEGFLPVITFAKKYLPEKLKNGFNAHFSEYIPTLKCTAGTIGVKYFIPESEHRCIAILRNPQKTQYNIQPRLTGPEKSFQGVITTSSHIDLEDFIIIDADTMEILYPEKKGKVKTSVDETSDAVAQKIAV